MKLLKCVSLLCLLILLRLTTNAEVVFSDNFNSIPLTQAEWNLVLSKQNNSPYYNSLISQTNGVITLTDGAYISPHITAKFPIIINSSYGTFNQNAGSSLYLTLRSDGTFNTSWNPYYPQNYPVASGLMIQLGSSANIIRVLNVGHTGAIVQVSEVVVQQETNCFGFFNSFSVTDTGTNLNISLNGHEYVSALSNSFATGTNILISTDYRYSGQPADAQISLDDFIITSTENRKNNDTYVLAIKAATQIQQPSSTNLSGLITTPVPLKSTFTTATILSYLAQDEHAAGNYPSSSFPAGALLVVRGDSVIVTDSATNELVDVSDILTAQTDDNSVFSGKQNKATGLAAPMLSEIQYQKLVYDDSAITNGAHLSFTLGGLATVVTKDTVNAIAGTYSETVTSTVKSGAGTGNFQGTPFILTGSFTASCKKNALVP